MRYIYIITLTLFGFLNAYCQKLVVRQFDSKIIGKDSANIFFDENYGLIEENCAHIIRYAHYDVLHSHYIGKFKDVNKFNPASIISEGNYSEKGKKDGAFVLYYLNGKLQSKGSFNNGKYDGDWLFYYSNGNLKAKGNFKNGNYNSKWEFYFENGQPNLFMEIVDGKCIILNCWTIDGIKTVEKGNGEYATYNGLLNWSGKLKDGVPDKKWSFKTEFASGNEQFEDGKFIKGENNALTFSEYTDKSRIVFLPSLPNLTISRAEILFPASDISCNGADYSKYRGFSVKPFK